MLGPTLDDCVSTSPEFAGFGDRRRKNGTKTRGVVPRNGRLCFERSMWTARKAQIIRHILCMVTGQSRPH